MTPLKIECSRIEDDYNSQIEKIRPSVLEAKQKYENQRMNHIHQIEARFSRQLHDLQNKHDDAVAKIEAYKYSGREPRGGLRKQYSIRESTESRIEHLENEREKQTDAINEKYNAFIAQAQERIDSIEKAKQNRLEEPRKKINKVNGATDRLTKAIDKLIENHDAVITMGLTSGISHPPQINENKFRFYMPTVIAKFDTGEKTRKRILTANELKEDKSIIGSLKGLVGMKFRPFENANESLNKFIASVLDNQQLNSIISALEKQHNLLNNPQTNSMVLSGIDKMQAHGWIKEKEATEFKKALAEYFVSTDSRNMPVELPFPKATMQEPPKVRFITYAGVEKWVEIDKLDALRKEDQEEFNKASLFQGASGSTRLLEYLKNLRIPHNKQYCIDHNEEWVQNQLYALLANSEFRADLRREFPFNVGGVDARIDFEVSGIGIEVKIFRSGQDFDRLVREILLYGNKYSEIIVPYINAGGLSNQELEARLELLSKQYKQIKGYVPLNCSDM